MADRPRTARPTPRRPGPRRRTTCSGGPRRRRLRQPGAARRAATARARRTRRRVRDRAGRRHPARTGHLRRDPRRLRGPTPARRGQCRRAAPRCPPAAGDAGADPRRDQHDRRPGARQGRPGSGRLHQRRAAQGRAQHDCAGWVRRVAPDPAADPVGYAAVAHSHPRWIVDQLTRGRGGGGARRPAGRRQRGPAGGAGGPARAGRGRGAPRRPTRFSPYGVVLEGGDPASVPAVAEGRAGVQDEGSQLVALALSRARVDGRDERWLDLCAGPGGKAALLAGVAAEQGARLLAAELRPHRAEARRPGPRRRRRHAGHGRRRRHPPALGAGTLRPGPRRRPLLGSRCPAPTAGGPVAPYRRRPRRPGAASGAAARQRARQRPPRWGRPLRHLLAGAGRDSGVVETILDRRDDVDLLDAARLLPEVTDAAGTLRRHPPAMATPAPDGCHVHSPSRADDSINIWPSC